MNNTRSDNEGIKGNKTTIKEIRHTITFYG